MDYEYQCQRKRLRIWRDCPYVPAFSPDLQGEDRCAEEPSAVNPTNSGHHPGATTLGTFMAVARRSKAKPCRVFLRCSGPSSDVELANRGGPPASSKSAAPQRGVVVRICDRVCGVPCKLRVAPDRATHQNVAVDGAVLIAQEETVLLEHGRPIHALAAAAISAAVTATAAQEAADVRERREAEAIAREAAAAHEARAAQEAITKKEAEVRALAEALAQERARNEAEERVHATPRGRRPSRPPDRRSPRRRPGPGRRSGP